MLGFAHVALVVMLLGLLTLTPIFWIAGQL